MVKVTMDETKPIDPAKFLQDESLWPQWPICPVKRCPPEGSKGLPLEYGIVLSSTMERTPVVTILGVGEFNPERYKAAKKHRYETFEDLVADGWMID